jgi:C4-dicarboxylate-specific signal transduction histidine kinase
LRRTEKFALLGEVAGRITHEMNQPMAAISMAAENGLLALERVPANLETVRDKFLRIEQQVERIIAVIGHISAFGRKQLSADLTELDIDHVLHSALAVAEPKMASAGVSVRLDIPDDLPPPRGVAVLLEQIVVNLIVNACDAYQDQPGQGQPGLGERIIAISALVADGSFVLRVADRAGGIPAHLLGGIFDPFVTSKPPGKGTGLGLSFCLASVGRLGGQLTATNVDGGASFYVTLPIASHTRQHADVD